MQASTASAGRNDRTRHEPGRRLIPLLLVVICALAAVYRFRQYNPYGLWGDEIYEYEWARLGWAAMVRFFVQYFNCILPSVLLKLYLYVFPAEATLHVPYILAGVLCVPAVYLLGRRLHGRAAGLIAALLLAANPFAVYYSREVRVYVLLLLVTLACHLVFLHLLEARSVKAYVLYALAVAVGLQTAPFFFFAWMPQVGYALLSPLWRRIGWRGVELGRAFWVTAAVLAVAAVLIYLPKMQGLYGFAHSPHVSLDRAGGLEWSRISRIFGDFYAAPPLAGWRSPSYLLLALWAVGIVIQCVRARSALNMQVLLLLLVLPCLLALFARTPTRYYISLLVPLLIGPAIGVAEIARLVPHRRLGALSAALLAVLPAWQLAPSAGFYDRYTPTPQYGPKNGCKQTQEFLARMAAPDEPLLIYHPGFAARVRHSGLYFTSLPNPVVFGDREMTADDLLGFLDTHGPRYLAFYGYNNPFPDGRVTALLQRDYELIAEYQQLFLLRSRTGVVAAEGGKLALADLIEEPTPEATPRQVRGRVFLMHPAFYRLAVLDADDRPVAAEIALGDLLVPPGGPTDPLRLNAGTQRFAIRLAGEDSAVDFKACALEFRFERWCIAHPRATLAAFSFDDTPDVPASGGLDSDGGVVAGTGLRDSPALAISGSARWESGSVGRLRGARLSFGCWVRSASGSGTVAFGLYDGMWVKHKDWLVGEDWRFIHVSGIVHRCARRVSVRLAVQKPLSAAYVDEILVTRGDPVWSYIRWEPTTTWMLYPERHTPPRYSTAGLFARP